MAEDPEDTGTGRRDSERTWQLRSKRGLWKWTFRVSMVSAIVDPWVLFWLALKK